MPERVQNNSSSALEADKAQQRRIYHSGAPFQPLGKGTLGSVALVSQMGRFETRWRTAERSISERANDMTPSVL